MVTGAAGGYLGRPADDEILRLRIDAAKEMLRNDEAKTTEIAAACGFNSIQVFYATFKRVTGSTPAQYRRSQL